ncbi:hypothetical protein EDF70_11511 [Neorhizobium sp. JUb45]|nr:hypothetical protein EDF70_11511 [Neorhizobium sp. JUb45]
MKLCVCFEQLSRIDAGNIRMLLEIEMFEPRAVKRARVELEATQKQPGGLQRAAYLRVAALNSAPSMKITPTM